MIEVLLLVDVTKTVTCFMKVHIIKQIEMVLETSSFCTTRGKMTDPVSL